MLVLNFLACLNVMDWTVSLQGSYAEILTPDVVVLGGGVSEIVK